MNKAVFFDKDGTLIEDVPYNVDPEKIKIYDDVPESLRLLKESGYKIIVISNQAGVAKGHFEETELEKVWQKISQELKVYQLEIDGYYYCPHHYEGKVEKYKVDCSCRKPKPGMILKAAKDFNIDLPNSWMVGDILNDVEAGNTAGCKTILINNGNETEWILNQQRTPTFVAKNVTEAVQKILNPSEAEIVYKSSKEML